MTTISLDDFSREVECIFKGERYSVRDNGAIYRHSRVGKRVRPNDNSWSFGKENSTNPYLHISNVRVHRIVATAFHGDPPDSKYVVDHIDTNCRNNRPENLRWLTRLENSLKNPVTRKKIEYLCGNIEAFLENPSMLNNFNLEPNFAWMRAVTEEEAQNCKVRMHLWANTENNKKSKSVKSRRSFDKKVFKPLKKWEVFGREPGLDLSKTPWCAQYMWRAPVIFPSFPQELGEDPLNEYYANLIKGNELASSEHQNLCPKLVVSKSLLLKERDSILVQCISTNESYSIVGIEYDKKTNHFIHFYLGTYLSKVEAEKAFDELKVKKDWWGASLSMA